MTTLQKDQDDFVCKKNCFVCIRLFYNVIDDSKIQHLSDFIEQHVKLSSPFLLEKVISIYKNILNIETLKMRIDHIIKLYSTYRICYYYPDYAKSFSTNLFGLTILAKNIIKKNLNVYLCRSNPKAIFIANPDAIDAVRFSIKVEDYKDMNSVCFCLDKHDMSLSDPLIVVGGAINLIKSLKPTDIFNAPTIKVGPSGPTGPTGPSGPSGPSGPASGAAAGPGGPTTVTTSGPASGPASGPVSGSARDSNVPRPVVGSQGPVPRQSVSVGSVNRTAGPTGPAGPAGPRPLGMVRSVPRPVGPTGPVRLVGQLGTVGPIDVLVPLEMDKITKDVDVVKLSSSLKFFGSNIQKDIMLSAVPVGASAVPIGASAVPVGASAVPVGASAVPVGASAVPVGASAVPVGASAVPVSASAVPVSASAVPVGASASPVSASKAKDTDDTTSYVSRTTNNKKSARIDLIMGNNKSSSPKKQKH
jgi:hypothetical protein